MSITIPLPTGISPESRDSFLLETAGKKILFDTGYSGLFLANTEKMGIDLRELDFIVLSHGHLDHSGGLVTLVRLLTEAKIENMVHRVPELIAHPLCFYPKEMLPLPNIGSILEAAEIRRHFPVNLSCRPIWITDDLVFLGEIPRKFAFEQTDPGKRRVHHPGSRRRENICRTSRCRLSVHATAYHCH